MFQHPNLSERLQPGRNWNSDHYRFGFNGKENDNEVKGTGNSVNFKYRFHDPRLGRFLSIDPLAPKYPHNSPYAFSENRVIDMVELEGLEPTEAGKDPKFKHVYYDTRVKKGSSIWFQYGTDRLPFELFKGTTGEITLITAEEEGPEFSRYSISHPSEIISKIEPMQPIVVTEIPIPISTQAPSPIETSYLTMSSASSTTQTIPMTSGYTGALGVPQDLGIEFQPSSPLFANGNQAMSSLRNMVTTLNNNPNLTATVTISTDLKQSAEADQLLISRAKNVYNTIKLIDPNFNMSRIIPGAPQYETSHRVTATYTNSTTQ